MRSSATGTSGTLFAIICWTVWKTRCDVVLNDRMWTHWQILSQITKLQNSIVGCYGPTEKAFVKEICWLPPHDNVVKLNVDGSSFGNPGKFDFGGLFRNSHGEWLLGFAGSCGHSTIMNAKLLAIYHGLVLASTASYHNVICEIDSKVALALISEGTQHYHPMLLLSIRSEVSIPILGDCPSSILLGKKIFVLIGLQNLVPIVIAILPRGKPAPPQLNSLLLADAMGFVRLR